MYARIVHYSGPRCFILNHFALLCTILAQCAMYLSAPFRTIVHCCALLCTILLFVSTLHNSELLCTILAQCAMHCSAPSRTLVHHSARFCTMQDQHALFYTSLHSWSAFRSRVNQV